MKLNINNRNTFLIAGYVLTLLFLGSKTYAQTQKGIDIDGEAAGDLSGTSVSMPDVNTIAIGAPKNNGVGLHSGHTRIYDWNGAAWVQKGADIDAEAAGDYAGTSVSMPDLNTVAIGAVYNDGNGSNAGQVRVYSWNGSAWIQKGSDIDGQMADDQFGVAVCMPDVNTVAAGAQFNNGGGPASGHIAIYSFNGNDWVLTGDLGGEAAGDQSGISVSMPDAFTVAVGAIKNDGNGTNAGHVRIYFWNGNTWIQKGIDIDGEAAGDESGQSVSMPDENTVAIGAMLNDGNGTDAGHVRIYIWNGINWVQKGFDIDGEAMFDHSGSSVSMPDANTVAIGAELNDGNGNDSGHTRVFIWDGTAWIQSGIDIDGEATLDHCGISVFMPDATTVAVGADENNGNGMDAGHVRIYSGFTVGIPEFNLTEQFNIYPNPANQFVTLSFWGEPTKDIKIELFDIYCQLIDILYVGDLNTSHWSKTFDISNISSGVYLLKVGNNTNRIVKL